MKVYGYDIKFDVTDKQGNLLNNHPVVLKMKNNTGFFLEDDSEGLLIGTPTQTKSFVSSGYGEIVARMYFKTPEAINVLEDIVSEDVDSITPVLFDKNWLSLEFKDTVHVGDDVDFNIVCTDPDLNGISETINIYVNSNYYDSVQTDQIGNATYNYNNTNTAGLQTICICCTNADTQSKEMEIKDESV